MKLYIDLCCFGRLFDLQDQPRVKLEGEAVLLILREISQKRHDLISSEILEFENDNNPDIDQRLEVKNLLRLAGHRVVAGAKEEARAGDLVRKGLRTYDALHIVCAESAGVDYFLSTDKKVVNFGRRYRTELAVSIVNPVEWLRDCRQ